MSTSTSHSDNAGQNFFSPNNSNHTSCNSRLSNDLTGSNFSFNNNPHVPPFPVSHILFNPETKKKYVRNECIAPGCTNLVSEFYSRGGLCANCQIKQARAHYDMQLSLSEEAYV